MNKKKSRVLRFKKFEIEYLLIGSPTFDFDSFSTLTYILSDFCLFFFFLKEDEYSKKKNDFDKNSFSYMLPTVHTEIF